MKFLFSCLYAISLLQNSVTFIDAVMYLTGAGDVSEISQDDFEQFERLHANPLKINHLSRNRLESSGLLSSYQAASVLDYRSRCGDILSSAELSSVDGFNRHIAEQMCLFIDFSPVKTGLTEMNRDSGFSGKATCGAAIKIADGQGEGQWLGKMEGCICPQNGANGIWDFSIAGKSPWSRPLSLPEELGWSVSYSGTEHVSRIVAGCFNTRFGQGLCEWSGVQMTSVSTPSSLMKRPTGIKSYTSYSPSYAHFGVASQLDYGHLSLNVFADVGPMSELLKTSGSRSNASFASKIVSSGSAGTNLVWNHRNGEIGITAVIPFSSPRNCSLGLDFQQTLKNGTVLFGEIARQQNTLALLAGTRAEWNACELGARLSSSYFEKNVSSAISWLSESGMYALNCAASLSYFSSSKGETPKGGMQLKTVSTFKISALQGFTSQTRFTSRWRNWGNRSKYDLRQDFRWEQGPASVTLRVNAAYCNGLSGLGYVEGGYRTPSDKYRLGVYLQTGAFIADNWDDRLYLYQRDAPQNFNIMTVYGRGYWTTLYCSFDAGRQLKLYLRANWTAYPWARSGDTHTRPSLSARIQAVWSM